MREGFNRRDVMRFAAGVAASGPAWAQEPIKLFGVTVPQPLIDKVKARVGPLNLLDMVTEILALERQANAKGLPYSPLDAIKPPPLVAVEGSFYESAVPRLVSLIDRSEARDPETAEKAGALLADVNTSQHVVPDALKPVPLRLSTARDFSSLKDEYAQLFKTAEVRAQHKDAVAWQAAMINQSRLRYEAVSKDVQVPWFFVGAIHGLEASFNFRAHLHNGDFPLKQRTRQVPAGHPTVWLPPDDWESSAKDAMKLMGFAGKTDWSLERTLYRLEAYNGFGYRKQLVPTPYLWGYSNHYEAGKFVADGKWSATAKSRQCGAAVVIKALVDGGTVSFG